MASKPTTDAIKIIHKRLYAGKPHRLKALADAIANDKLPGRSANSGPKRA